MKCFMVTSGENPDRIHAHKWLQRLREYRRDLYPTITAVTNNQTQLKSVKSLKLKIDVVSADIPDSVHLFKQLSYTRNWIMDNLVDDGEIVLLTNDNIVGINFLRSKEDKQDFETASSTEWRRRYNQLATPKMTFDLIELIKKKMEEMGSWYGGIGSVSGNYFFCARRWNFRGYVRGDIIFTKKVNTPWCDPRIYLWDDWFQTCTSLANSGSVTCLRYASAVRHETVHGGLGASSDRIEYQRKSMKILLKLFPGMIEPHPKSKTGDSLRLCLRSKSQIEHWRKDMGYLC